MSAEKSRTCTPSSGRRELRSGAIANLEAVIYDRNKLHEGLTVPGPAIVSEMDSTTVVLPGYEARVDAVGNLLINPAQ